MSLRFQFDGFTCRNVYKLHGEHHDSFIFYFRLIGPYQKDKQK